MLTSWSATFPQVDTEFLSQLILGVPLGEAAAVALEETPAFDLPETIAGMIRVGAFTTIKHGDGI